MIGVININFEDVKKEQQQQEEVLKELVMKIGVEHEHLAFKDVLSISESMVELVIEAQQIMDRSDNNDKT